MVRVSGTRYVNNDYGYSVDIPAGRTAWMNAAPSPNHGIRIFLGQRRSIETDASFDSALLGSTAAVAGDVARSSGNQANTSPDHLGGRTAERVLINGPGDRRRIVVVRWADQGSQGVAINDVLSLETISTAFEQDERTFDDMVSSFRYRPRPAIGHH